MYGASWRRNWRVAVAVAASTGASPHAPMYMHAFGVLRGLHACMLMWQARVCGTVHVPYVTSVRAVAGSLSSPHRRTHVPSQRRTPSLLLCYAAAVAGAACP